jgi:hypothetical protein
MIRKSLIALAAVATMSVAALAPTSASAWGFKGGWHHHYHGFGLGFIDVAPVSDCYLVQKVNRYGQVRMIRVCD